MTAAQRLHRRLARRINRALFRLYRALLPTRVGAGPVDPRALRRVLVLPNYKVGDLVVALPALDYLRQAAPHARLDVLLSPRNASLVAGDARVDRVVLYDPRQGPRWAPGWPALGWPALALQLRRAHYDLVVDLVLPHHLREGLLTAAAAGHAGARVTPRRPPRVAGLFTHRPRVPGFERRYMADRMLYAVAAAVRPPGAAAPDPDRLRAAHPMRLAVDPAADARVAAWLAATAGGPLGGDPLGSPLDGPCGARPFVAVNAWASDPVRTLGVAQGRALLAVLAARHPEVAFVVTPPPGAEADAAAMAAGTRALVVPPAPGLADLVALLARAAAVVTPDTANIHLAAAVGRPVVALFATVATETLAHWVPSGVPHRVVTLGGGRPLGELAPERAAAAFDALWAEIGGAADAPRAPAESPVRRAALQGAG